MTSSSIFIQNEMGSADSSPAGDVPHYQLPNFASILGGYINAEVRHLLPRQNEHYMRAQSSAAYIAAAAQRPTHR